MPPIVSPCHRMKEKVKALLEKGIPEDLILEFRTLTLASGVKVPTLTGEKSGIDLLYDDLKGHPISPAGELAEMLRGAQSVVMPGKSGVGKTRTVYELLAAQFGLYLTAERGGEAGSEALEKMRNDCERVLSDQRVADMTPQQRYDLVDPFIDALLLAYLLVFDHLKGVHPGLTPEQWLLLQCHPRPLGLPDLINEIYKLVKGTDDLDNWLLELQDKKLFGMEGEAGIIVIDRTRYVLYPQSAPHLVSLQLGKSDQRRGLLSAICRRLQELSYRLVLTATTPHVVGVPEEVGLVSNGLKEKHLEFRAFTIYDTAEAAWGYVGRYLPAEHEYLFKERCFPWLRGHAQNLAAFVRHILRLHAPGPFKAEHLLESLDFTRQDIKYLIKIAFTYHLEGAPILQLAADCYYLGNPFILKTEIAEIMTVGLANLEVTDDGQGYRGEVNEPLILDGLCELGKAIYGPLVPPKAGDTRNRGQPFEPLVVACLDSLGSTGRTTVTKAFGLWDKKRELADHPLWKREFTIFDPATPGAPLARKQAALRDFFGAQATKFCYPDTVPEADIACSLDFPGVDDLPAVRVPCYIQTKFTPTAGNPQENFGDFDTAGSLRLICRWAKDSDEDWPPNPWVLEDNVLRVYISKEMIIDLFPQIDLKSVINSYD